MVHCNDTMFFEVRATLIVCIAYIILMERGDNVGLENTYKNLPYGLSVVSYCYFLTISMVKTIYRAYTTFLVFMEFL